ncbi:MAG TPA: CDP-alcohol phosphatidyltransferase family protein [Allosphingosinicella sp.]|jgi:CDP-L-myo-inositol myo-inositolphosphotransferase|nr:CDP-alcohol phosphatidyltransferase family protein [Allosphingosinicella sp.]
MLGSEKSGPTVAAFASAAAADRPIAGVATAARAARALIDEGANGVRLLVGDGAPLAPATMAEIERLRGPATVTVARGEGPAPLLPTAWAVVRATGKPSDGLVSRWLNRPISQRITWLVLAIPGIRPVHVTIFNGVLAMIMFAVLLAGGHGGLFAGGLLFQAASIIDGVDGEMARATFRSSASGATMDSVVDIATNLLFVFALTVNLALRDHDAIGWIGGWAVTLSILGGMLIAWRTRAGGGPLGFDLLKRSGTRIRGPVDLIYWAVQTLTGRDCFAFLFMALILTGLERTALSIYAGVGTLWFLYVLTTLLPRSRAVRGAA